MKGVKYFVIFLLPVLANNFIVAYPELMQLTLGAVLVMLVNIGKNWAQVGFMQKYL